MDAENETYQTKNSAKTHEFEETFPLPISRASRILFKIVEKHRWIRRKDKPIAQKDISVDELMETPVNHSGTSSFVLLCVSILNFG